MRAVLLDRDGLRVTDRHPAPREAPGETRIRVLGAGICETDLQLMQGYMGFQGVLGHEFVGVAKSGPWSGRRIVGEINCSCGVCPACRQGDGPHCPHRSVLGILNRDGAFADELTLPQQNLHLVPDSVSNREAVFVEPLAAAFRIPEQIVLRPGLEAIVLGDGRLGNLCAQVLRQVGCQVLVLGKHRDKLAVIERLKLPVALVADFRQRRCADLVVDCTGSPTGLPLALELVRPRGTVVLKTTVAGSQTLALAPIVIDEVTLVGSRCGPFPRAIEALRQREIDVSGLVSQTFPLEQAVSAFEMARTRPVLKLLLEVDPSFSDGPQRPLADPGQALPR